MAYCATEVGGYLQLTATAPDQCTEYLVLSPVDYSWVMQVGALFDFPTVEQLQDAFYLGCSLPVLAWLTAQAFSAVINMIPKRGG